MSQSLKKHPGGRPTKYSGEILNTTFDYITNYKDYDDVVPTIAGLAQALETSREVIYKWMGEENKPEFMHMCSRIMTAQERMLVNGGLENKYNSNVTKLMLSKHGYTDNQDKQGVSVHVTINRGRTEVVVNDKSLTIDND